MEHDCFDRDGKILEWMENTLRRRLEGKYVDDESGKLIRISGSDGDQVEEFRYDEQGRKTRIRQAPPQPEPGSRAFGIAAWFDAAAEGGTLTDGGTVETMYNERDQPVEVRILDNEGTVSFRIVHTYDADDD
jgi:YD repeat-containing protein